MEENGIITGQIPVTGYGVHKTYEESIIRVIISSDFRAYNNAYFLNKTTGKIHWTDNEEVYREVFENDQATDKYKKVEILSVAGFGPGDDRLIVEFIDSNALRQHLIAEAVIRNQNHQDDRETNDNTTSNSHFGISKTYLESMFRIINTSIYKLILERSNYGMYIKKSNGCFVIPTSKQEYEKAQEQRKLLAGYQYDFYESIDYIESHLEEFEEVELVKAYPIGDGSSFYIEILNKDIYEKYESFNRRLTI